MMFRRGRQGAGRASASRKPSREADTLGTGSALRHAEQLLAEKRKELTRADGKASILLAAVGVAGSVIGGAIVEGRWNPSRLGEPWRWVWWVGIAVAAMGILLLGYAVIPRVRHRGPREKVAYFGHAVMFEDPASFARALGEAAKDPLARALDQVWVLSRVVQRKYRATRNAMVLLATAIAMLIAAVLGEHVAS